MRQIGQVGAVRASGVITSTAFDAEVLDVFSGHVD
jgi:hypothetical protein